MWVLVVGVHTRRVPDVNANGVSLYYEEHGSGEAIVCIHGTLSSAGLWRQAATELGTRGRTIVYDRRGFSRSERPERFVADVHLHADDAAALVDALAAGPAIVIGRSAGGEIAVDLALRYADRVRALALLEGGELTLSEAAMRWIAEVDEQVFNAAETDMGTVAETLFRAVAGDAAWDALPESVKDELTGNSQAILADERNGYLEVRPEQLGAIVQPVLLVAANDSPPEFAEVTNLMVQAIPSAHVEWVEGGHLINPAHPAVLSFVDELLAGP
jgi:pimeloyl-ACP methyl ester carboxylesterase